MENIHKRLFFQVTCFQKHACSVHVCEFSGSIRKVFLHREPLSSEKNLRFRDVGSYHSRPWEKFRGEGGDGFFLYQTVSGSGDHYGVKNYIPDIELVEHSADASYYFRRMEHSDFDRIRTDVGEYGFYLSLENVYRHGTYCAYSKGVLYRNGGNRRCCIASTGGNRFDVRLCASASSGVAAGDGENCIVSFHFNRCMPDPRISIQTGSISQMPWS